MFIKMTAITKLTLLFVVFFSVTFSAIAGSQTSITHDILPPDELITALQSGGYLIYMRHGKTNHTQKDKMSPSLGPCSEQRNLSQQGRAILTNIGEKLSQLNIPIGSVVTSPFCRCKDTAQIVFGKYTVEPNLIFSISKNKDEAEQLGKILYEMMLSSDNVTQNNVFISHTSNLKDGLNIWPKPEGVMVIFKKHNDQLVFKGMIEPDVWLEQEIAHE